MIHLIPFLLHPLMLPSLLNTLRNQCQNLFLIGLGFDSFLDGHTRSASSVTPSSESTPTSLLPPSLRRLPLYLYSLRRGCLFGDCFHNGDLLQLHRLRLASATLQDSLRIILPQLTIAQKRRQSLLLESIQYLFVLLLPVNPLISVSRPTNLLVIVQVAVDLFCRPLPCLSCRYIDLLPR